ncbi:TolC family protein [Marinilabiliaceae bacterium JC017]|nr:TolC family protein [Marinilabiliaceae bacterium JC017]
MNQFYILLFSLLIPVLVTGQNTSEMKNWTLDDCIHYAWDNNVKLQEKENTTDILQLQLDQSKANLGPDLSLTARHSLAYDNIYSSETDSWNRESTNSTNVSLGSNITLYNGAKLKNTIRQNNMNLGASESALQTQRDLISLEVLNAYVNVLLAYEQLENNRNQLQTTKEELSFALERKNIGIISEADLLQVKSQYANEKANVTVAESSVQIARVNLMQTMNMPISADFEITTPDVVSLLVKDHAANAIDVYQAALNFFPEIKSAEYEVESAMIGIDIAKAATKPELSFFANVETNYNSMADYAGFSEQISHNMVPVTGLSLSIPIYQKKAAKTKITTAQIEADNSRLFLTDTQNNLRKAIEQACVDAASAKATYEAMKELNNAQRESYNVAEEMFRQGLISTLDFIIQKNDLATSEIKLSLSSYDFILKTKVVDYYRGEPVKF